MLTIVYSHDTRRTVKGILFSFTKVLDVVGFYFLYTIFWAFIGVKMIGRYKKELKFDEVFYKILKEFII